MCKALAVASVEASEPVWALVAVAWELGPGELGAEELGAEELAAWGPAAWGWAPGSALALRPRLDSPAT